MSDHSENTEAQESDRYELDDLFDGEGEDTQNFLKMVGVVVLVVLVVVACGYPLKYF